MGLGSPKDGPFGLFAPHRASDTLASEMRGRFSGRCGATSAAVVAALVAFAVGADAAGAATRTFTFAPVADAYVSSSAPGTNYGTASTLTARSSPVRRSYLRFSVTGLGLPASRAVLRLTPVNSSSTSLRVRRVSSTTWGETTITYSNAPPYSTSDNDPYSGQLTAGKPVDINVTKFVTGNGPVSLALTGRSSELLTLSSREAGAALSPKLIVETPGTAPDGSLAWPIPGAFYYPWFPEAWNQFGYVCGNPPPAGFPATPSGCFTRYRPSLGFYSSESDAAIDSHVRALDYGRIEVAITSWWGPGGPTDTRVARLLARTSALGSRLKWALYYELEGYDSGLSVDAIRSHLNHIVNVKRYTSHSRYARVGGRPVLFVYNANDASCAVGEKWKQANVGYNFHLVLKVFPGYRNCGLGLDWHQYGPAVAEDVQSGFSFTISPGYWRGDEAAPRLARDPARWQTNVARMRAANVHWQLVTSFNEWGEGTAVESAQEWASPSGYGVYLDALRS
jgi:hypothetical protein